MASFPRSEAETVALVEAMIVGLTNNPGIFAAPPVDVLTLTTARDAYIAARTALINEQAKAEQATATKDDALRVMVAGMKSDLRYAENTVGFDDELLKLLGWGGRRPATPLQPPGQALVLTAREQGEGWVDLAWKPPVEGGKPSAYRLVRRERPAGPWADVATAIVTEARLLDQPRGKEFEYQVIAVNKAGEGPASNTVMVIL